MMISILRVSGFELHSSGTEPVTFFGAQSSLGGYNSRLRGARTRNAPRGAEPGAFIIVHYIVTQTHVTIKPRDSKPVHAGKDSSTVR